VRKLLATIFLLPMLVWQPPVAQTGGVASASSPSIPARTGIFDPILAARVEALLRKMTLEGKVGQLVQYSAGQPTGSSSGRTDYGDMIAKGQNGARLNIATAKETNALQRVAVENLSMD
jgi:beta-glucosidase